MGPGLHGFAVAAAVAAAAAAAIGGAFRRGVAVSVRSVEELVVRCCAGSNHFTCEAAGNSGKLAGTGTGSSAWFQALVTRRDEFCECLKRFDSSIHHGGAAADDDGVEHDRLHTGVVAKGGDELFVMVLVFAVDCRCFVRALRAEFDVSEMHFKGGSRRVWVRDGGFALSAFVGTAGVGCVNELSEDDVVRREAAEVML